MNLGEMRVQVRRWLRDTIQPNEWDDTTLNMYLNSALREAVLRSRPLKQVETVTVTNGVADYDLSDLPILYLESVTIESQPEIPLERFSHVQWAEICYTSRTTNAVGTPSSYALDGGTSDDELYCSPMSLSLWPTPAGDDVATLRFFAKPEQMCQDCDFPCLGDSEDHFKLTHWAAHLAFMEHDTDNYNPEAAAFHRQEFTTYFGTRITAEQRYQRQRDSHDERIIVV